MKKNVENLKPSGKGFFSQNKERANEGRFFIEEVVNEAYKKSVFFIPNSLFLTFYEITLSFSQKNYGRHGFPKAIPAIVDSTQLARVTSLRFESFEV